MMPSNDSLNKYVDLVTTLPDVILRGDSKTGLNSYSAAVLAVKTQRYAKIFVEVGSGSGAHLVERAAREPDALFIGFELRFKRVFKTAEKALQLGLSNVLVIQMNACRISELFPTQALDGIFIFFPDPWDKRRWKKHRIITPEYLELIHKLLKPGCFLHYKSDHAEYFDFTVAMIEDSGRFAVANVCRDVHAMGVPADYIASEFEKLFKYKNLPVHSVLAAKI